jgi:LCCL domain-containing protein
MTAHDKIPGMTTRHRLLLPISAVLMLVACSAPAAATPEPTADPTPTTAAPASAPATDPWAATAGEHRGLDGEQFTYNCPPDGDARSLWGTDVYTDDSSVCTAAVHAGAITIDEGGEVRIEIRPGEDSYEGTEQNGIESSPYGAWGGSFVVVTD